MVEFTSIYKICCDPSSHQAPPPSPRGVVLCPCGPVSHGQMCLFPTSLTVSSGNSIKDGCCSSSDIRQTPASCSRLLSRCPAVQLSCCQAYTEQQQPLKRVTGNSHPLKDGLQISRVSGADSWLLPPSDFLTICAVVHRQQDGVKVMAMSGRQMSHWTPCPWRDPGLRYLIGLSAVGGAEGKKSRSHELTLIQRRDSMFDQNKY